jgi:hypothetical protein
MISNYWDFEECASGIQHPRKGGLKQLKLGIVFGIMTPTSSYFQTEYAKIFGKLTISMVVHLES